MSNMLLLLFTSVKKQIIFYCRLHVSGHPECRNLRTPIMVRFLFDLILFIALVDYNWSCAVICIQVGAYCSSILHYTVWQDLKCDIYCAVFVSFQPFICAREQCKTNSAWSLPTTRLKTWLDCRRCFHESGSSSFCRLKLRPSEFFAIG